jgi:hypothetical protein
MRARFKLPTQAFCGPGCLCSKIGLGLGVLCSEIGLGLGVLCSKIELGIGVRPAGLAQYPDPLGQLGNVVKARARVSINLLSAKRIKKSFAHCLHRENVLHGWNVQLGFLQLFGSRCCKTNLRKSTPPTEHFFTKKCLSQ